MQVDEFCKDVYVRHLRAFGDKGLLIIWEWDLLFVDSDTDSRDSTSTALEHVSSSGEHDSMSDTDECTIAFKCIGVTRDPSYQQTLKTCKQRRDNEEDVKVKLVPEPDNPYDSRAICFKCKLDSTWHTIGYVVSEICEDVHDALISDDIISTEFAWVKYKLWKKSPGYYAAINITRRGEWSNIVKKSCSTFF